MNISDEAVEAVARWLWARDSNDIIEGPRPSWDDLATSGIVWKSGLADTRQEARELLEAAAPHIAVQAWDEGWDNARATYLAIYAEHTLPDWVTLRNPYRSAGAGE